MANNIFDLAGSAGTIAPSPQRLPIISKTDGAASIPTVALASIIQDPEARIRYYSQKMGIPVSKFGIADGNIVYQTKDNTLQQVSPRGFSVRLRRGLARQYPLVAVRLAQSPGF